METLLPLLAFLLISCVIYYVTLEHQKHSFMTYYQRKRIRDRQALAAFVFIVFALLDAIVLSVVLGV